MNDADIDKLGGTYYVVDPVWPHSQCDVGPTVYPDNHRLGLPHPDDFVEFEDLMIFATNYGAVAPRVVPFLDEEPSKVLSLSLAERLAEGEDIEIALRVEGNAGEVKGLSAEIEFDPSELEFTGARLADGMLSPLGRVFFWYGEDAGRALIDMAVLGTDVTLGGSGDVAVLSFRALADEYALDFASVRLRGAENDALAGEYAGIEAKPEVPTVFRLAQNSPNPFNPVTTIEYHVPNESPVSVRVHDVAGRLVRTLVDGPVEAGRHAVVWDGRNDSGEQVGSGVYFCSMEAADYRSARKMVLLK